MVSLARAQSPTQSGVQSGLVLSLKPADLVFLAGFSACALCSALGRSQGWEAATAIYLVLAFGPLPLRALSQRWHSRSLHLLADFFPTLSILVSYGHLDPVADAFHLPLADPRLIALDGRIFGLQPSVALAAHVGPWLSDVLMSCYCSYYLWPLLLGILLYLYKGEAAFDHWTLTVAVVVLLNYALYIAVPAIGPRFTLADSFALPVQGALAGPLFRAFLNSPYHRDCFPSGHTALTLTILWHAFRHLRPFFWAVLPIGLGVIVATVALRFHYGVDLIAAVPLTVVAYALSQRLYAALPRGVAVLTHG